MLGRGVASASTPCLDDPEIVQEIARDFGAVTGLYVPLLARDAPIGIVFAHDHRGRDPRFTDADLRLAEQFAQRASVAVDLSRPGPARRAAVIEGQEAERRRLARELHDETGQALTSVLLGLKNVETAQNVPAALARCVSSSSRPCRTSDASRSSWGRRRSTTSARARTRAARGDVHRGDRDLRCVRIAAREGRLAPEVETTLYRIAEEVLGYDPKHAGARNVSVLLVMRGSAATVVIEDDGHGFARVDEQRGGIGLAGMRERVALLDGRLSVESERGKGTTIVAEVPVT